TGLELMVVVIDNYDSFTYNLVQYLGELGAVVQVMRNDAVSLDTVAAAQPNHIVISPGPGRPEQAGVTMAVIRRFGQTTPILGVCLGHQAIGAVTSSSLGSPSSDTTSEWYRDATNGPLMPLKTPRPSCSMVDVLPCIGAPARTTVPPKTAPIA